MSKLKKIIICLLGLWLIVTAYIYVKDVITVKTMSVDGWNFSKENPVQIKEIRLINKRPGRIGIKGGFYYAVAVVKKIPGEKLKNFLIKTLHFYKAPCQKYEGGWELEISGVYLKKQSFQDDFLDPEMFRNKESVKIYTDGEQLSPHGLQVEEGSNLAYFTVMTSKVNPKVSSIKIDIDMGEKHYTKVFSAKFNTKTFGFFSQRPSEFDSFSVRKVISDELQRVKQGQKSGTVEYKSHDLKDRLLWIRENKDLIRYVDLGYLENYKNNKNVFTVALKTVKERTKNKFTGEQRFYLIWDNNKWVIVDVTPYKRL